jgi:mannosyltransferase OCH1-like enzyme
MLAKGDLAAAEDAARERLDDPAMSRWQRAHFSVSLEGSQLTELRLLRSLEKSGQDFDRLEFIVPARAVVARWIDRETQSLPADADVPRTVIQYWDRPEMPVEIAAMMKSWEGSAGFAYLRFDRSSAFTFLKQRLGPEWARAFRAARHPAEQADYFRLAYLSAEGGVYADADDRRVGDLRDLVSEAQGALLCVEPFGTVANNFLVAPPEHPVLMCAANEARQALLSRDNGGIWTKTGPGLLTRAVARHLCALGHDDEPMLALRRQSHFASVVQFHTRMAYKTAPGYWNSRRVAGDPGALRSYMRSLTISARAPGSQRSCDMMADPSEPVGLATGWSG